MVGITDRSYLQSVSKRAFNKKHLLAVASLFLENPDGLFDKDQVVSAIGVPPTTTYNDLVALAQLGALTEITDGGRRLFAFRDTSTFWAWAGELIRLAEAESSSVGSD